MSHSLRTGTILQLCVREYGLRKKGFSLSVTIKENHALQQQKGEACASRRSAVFVLHQGRCINRTEGVLVGSQRQMGLLGKRENCKPCPGNVSRLSSLFPSLHSGPMVTHALSTLTMLQDAHRAQGSSRGQFSEQRMESRKTCPAKCVCQKQYYWDIS